MSKITINAVGDVWFGDHPLCLGYGVNSLAKGKPDDYFFKYVKDHLNGDINFCNLESILSDVSYNPSKLDSVEMRGTKSSVRFLKYCNFNLINVANNHMMQHGTMAFYDTLNNLKSNNISVIGVDKSALNRKTYIHKYRKNDSTVFFVGFSLHEDTYSKEKIRYSFRDSFEELIKEIVEIKKDINDFLICSLHWGDEFIHYPSKKQIELAHRLIDSGVNILIGHHPHVLQGIERYKDGIIAYSLGNFLFDLWGNSTKKTIILKLIIENNVVESYSVLEVYINSSYQPAPATGVIKNEISEELKRSSEIIYNSDLCYNDGRYKQELSILEKKFSIDGYIYFLKNLFRYNIRFLFQLVMRKIVNLLSRSL